MCLYFNVFFFPNINHKYVQINFVSHVIAEDQIAKQRQGDVITSQEEIEAAWSWYSQRK